MKRNEKIAQQKLRTAKRLEKRHTPKIYKAIKDSILPAVEIIKRNPTLEEVDRAVQAMPSTPIERSIKRLHADGIETQGTHTRGYLTGKASDKYIQTKKTDFGEFSEEQTLWVQMIKDFELLHGSNKIISINDTNLSEAKRIIRKIISQANEEQLGFFEIQEMIEKAIKNEWRKNAVFRADRIARTEAGFAMAYGGEKGAESTGLTLVKQWLTFVDGRERESHQAANGQIVDFDQKFNVGGSQLKHPSDITGPAREVVNCRCAVVEMQKELAN